MPHKIKQAREHPRHRRLPHVKEDSEGEKDRPDEPTHTFRDAPASKSAVKPVGSVARKESTMGLPETLAMEGKYAKIETSPLPLQRALLSSAVSRKCGPSTPVPSWKMSDFPLQGDMEHASSEAIASPLMRGMAIRQSQCSHNTVSARKLAASLWEMQGALNASFHQGKDELTPQHHMGLVNTEHHHKGRKGLPEQVSGVGGHRGPAFEEEGGSSKQPKASKSYPKELKNSRSSGSPTPQEVSQSLSVNVVQPRGEDGSTLSCELVKVLNQIWSLEEQYNESTALVASLRSELKKTRTRIKELQKEQSSYQEDLVMLNKKLADEKKMLQDRLEEAVLAAVKARKEELDIERKSKVKLELKHKKLSKEINDTRKTLTKTLQEFEREQKARELMEDVCDELAREIGEDKAQVEELKRQSAKYREEVEQERRMLQMAEVWREERVHMKLAEARFELEEKNAALDKLRSELEAFLKAKRSLDEGNNRDMSNLVSNSEHAANSALSVGEKHVPVCQQPSKKEMAPVDFFLDENRSSHGVGELEGEDSLDDDLHSIELNRISYSGSREDPLSAQGNSINTKVVVNGKHSPSDAPSFPQSATGANNLKQGERSNLSLSEITSSSGEVMVSGGITSEIQEVESRLFDRGSEAGLKDWDLGKGRVGRSSGTLPRFWQDSAEGGVGVNERGRSGFGQMASLSRSGSKGEAMETVDRLNSKLKTFELPGDRSVEAQDDNGPMSFGRQAATFPSSPIRKWSAPSWSSHDPAKSGKATQPSENIVGQGFKDNSLKARLLEAKLECQQAKARNSKAAPVS